MLNKKAKTLNENNSQLELAIQKEIDMNKVTISKENFKLAMADELLKLITTNIEATKSYINVCDDYVGFHKKKELQKLEFYKQVLECKDGDIFEDITSCPYYRNMKVSK